jgi:glycosyltransferase EpsD
MSRILYVATSDIHIRTFHIPYLKWLKENGCEVHLAIENRGNLTIPYVDKIFYLPIPRKLFSLANFSSYHRIKTIIDENYYNLIHCHTPIASALTRLAARKARKKGSKVLYTVHGFYFYKDSGLKNWLIYYPVEYCLSAFTDVIITMNHEDLSYINGKMFHRESYLIPGVGVDGNIFYPFDEKRKSIERIRLDLNPDDFILLYVAEYIERKNHKMIIDAIQLLKGKIPNLKILFAGKGLLFEKIKKYADKKGVTEYINFMGFRNDMNILSAISDVGISASRLEGLPIGLLQEMFCAIPIVAPFERGHNELIIQGVNGFLYRQNDKARFAEYILNLYSNNLLRNQMGRNSLERAQKFSIENSLGSMANLYRRYI